VGKFHYNDNTKTLKFENYHAMHILKLKTTISTLEDAYSMSDRMEWMLNMLYWTLIHECQLLQPLENIIKQIIYEMFIKP